MKEINQSLEKIIQLLKKMTVHSVGQKEVFTIEELCLCTGYARSYVHKMTSARMIPFYKSPMGKKVIFRRDEINEWLLCTKMPITRNLRELMEQQAIWKTRTVA